VRWQYSWKTTSGVWSSHFRVQRLGSMTRVVHSAARTTSMLASRTWAISATWYLCYSSCSWCPNSDTSCLRRLILSRRVSRHTKIARSMTDCSLRCRDSLECLSWVIGEMPTLLTFASPTKTGRDSQQMLASKKTLRNSSCSSSTKWKSCWNKQARSICSRTFSSSRVLSKRSVRGAARPRTACEPTTPSQSRLKTRPICVLPSSSWSMARR